MKMHILKVILPNSIEEKYQSAGDFSLNIHLTSTISILQMKFISVRNILEYQNNKKVPAPLKLQASGVVYVVNNISKGPKFSESYWKLRQLMNSSSKIFSWICTPIL